MPKNGIQVEKNRFAILPIVLWGGLVWAGKISQYFIDAFGIPVVV